MSMLEVFPAENITRSTRVFAPSLSKLGDFFQKCPRMDATSISRVSKGKIGTGLVSLPGKRRGSDSTYSLSLDAWNRGEMPLFVYLAGRERRYSEVFSSYAKHGKGPV